MKADNSILSRVNFPCDIKSLGNDQLRQLASEIREFMILSLSKTGGHLGASLGVVEMSLALHKVFDTPRDKVIWDIGHQAYIHKIITGRKDRFHTIRQGGGISGFCDREESEYDHFGAGHSSTSISAGLGFMSDTQNPMQYIVPVIGDSAIGAGMAYEAMHNAVDVSSKSKHRLIIILNDNAMSIAQSTGSLASYFARIRRSRTFKVANQISTTAAEATPFTSLFQKFKSSVKKAVLPDEGTLFESLGLEYIGVVDGHSFEELESAFNHIKENYTKPVLLHVKTQKGKGYLPAENADDKFHGISKFDIKTGKVYSGSGFLSYSSVFGKFLKQMGEADKSVIAITAAMPDGTGLKEFAKSHPERFYDVGIAEQHATTFAAGIACTGNKPYLALYSTFLQRGYDQLVHDIAVQNLPVRICLDRAGLVGQDGATHNGVFDIAFAAALPNISIISPSSGADLQSALKMSLDIETPLIIRYPKASTELAEVSPFEEVTPLEFGKSRMMHKGTSKICVLSVGSCLEDCKKAIADSQIDVTLVDVIFIKPLDEKIILEIASRCEVLITVEEGSLGGFYSLVASFVAKNDINCKVVPVCMKDTFVPHNSMDALKLSLETSSEHIKNCILKYVK